MLLDYYVILNIFATQCELKLPVFAGSTVLTDELMVEAFDESIVLVAAFGKVRLVAVVRNKVFISSR